MEGERQHVQLRQHIFSSCNSSHSNQYGAASIPPTQRAILLCWTLGHEWLWHRRDSNTQSPSNRMTAFSAEKSFISGSAKCPQNVIIKQKAREAVQVVQHSALKLVGCPSTLHDLRNNFKP